MTVISHHPARAAVLRGKASDFLFENVEVEAPRRDEVLVKMVATGICHTDIGVCAGHFATPFPVILGHEGSGIVESVGEDIKDLQRGDHVIMTFISCGSCFMCVDGQPAHCQRRYPLNFMAQRDDGSSGTRDSKGALVYDRFFGQSALRTLALATRRNVVKVTKDVPLELLGPLGCGIQTGAGAVLNSLAVRAGSSIAVYGAGAVGLSAVMAARVAGATTIIAVDVTPSRLELAMELGATHVVNSKDVDPVATIKQITSGGAHYSLDCSGRPDVLAQAFSSLTVKGHCGLVGASPPGIKASIEMLELMSSGRSLTGIIQGDSNPPLFVPKLITLYQHGRFNFDRLIRFYDFEQLNEAIADAKSGVAVKPVIRLS